MMPPIYIPRSGLAGGSRLVPSILAGGPWDSQDYISRVLALNPIAFWGLNEGSGLVAVDLSGNGRNGAYSGVTLGQPGIGDGRTAAGFDGVNDYCNVYSAGLAAVFNGAEGTLFCWIQVSDAAVWMDGAERDISWIYADAGFNNVVTIRKPIAANTLNFLYKAGATTKQVSVTCTATGVIPVAITWNQGANEVKAYISGAQVGATQTGLGVWAGTLCNDGFIIGSQSAVAVAVWKGILARIILFNRALGDTTIACLSTVLGGT